MLRGTSLLFGKIALRTMGPLLLLGTRFLIAFVLVAFIFRKNLRNLHFTEMWHSALLGLVFFISTTLELIGLKTTPSSTTAFLEKSVIVIVPLIMCIIERKLPDRGTILGVILAGIGVILLTIKGVTINFTRGELYVMVGAVCYAFSVIITDYVCKKDDPSVVAVLQLFWIGAFSMVAALIFEDVRLPSSATEWGAILWLAIVCSGVGFTLQPFAQKYTTAERASLFVAFNPISAGILGVIFLHEEFTITSIIGSVLVLLAVIVPPLINGKKKNSAS